VGSVKDKIKDALEVQWIPAIAKELVKYIEDIAIEAYKKPEKVNDE